MLTAPDAIALTRVRGEAMAASCGATPTGMIAVLGGDEDAMLAAIANVGLTPANINATGQIVASGTLEQLAEFAANPPAGARLRPLRVAGAFHTKHMAPAVDALEAAAAGTKVKDPVITLLSNLDGAVVTSGPNWVDRIVDQVANPVRWDLCMATMSDIGVTAMIELSPAARWPGWPSAPAGRRTAGDQDAGPTQQYVTEASKTCKTTSPKPDDLIVEPENRRWKVVQVNQTEQGRCRPSGSPDPRGSPARHRVRGAVESWLRAQGPVAQSEAQLHEPASTLGDFLDAEMPDIMQLYAWASKRP